MKTIIRINNEDGSQVYVQSTTPTIETTEREENALRMEFKEAIATSLALGTLKIGHCMITKSNW